MDVTFVDAANDDVATEAVPFDALDTLTAITVLVTASVADGVNEATVVLVVVALELD